MLSQKRCPENLARRRFQPRLAHGLLVSRDSFLSPEFGRCEWEKGDDAPAPAREKPARKVARAGAMVGVGAVVAAQLRGVAIGDGGDAGLAAPGERLHGKRVAAHAVRDDHAAGTRLEDGVQSARRQRLRGVERHGTPPQRKAAHHVQGKERIGPRRRGGDVRVWYLTRQHEHRRGRQRIAAQRPRVAAARTGVAADRQPALLGLVHGHCRRTCRHADNPGDLPLRRQLRPAREAAGLDGILKPAKHAGAGRFALQVADFHFCSSHLHGKQLYSINQFMSSSKNINWL